LSLSLPILAGVLTTLLTALLATLLLISGLVLLRLAGLALLPALSGLRITFAALSFSFRLPWYASFLVTLQGVTLLRVQFVLSSCFEVSAIRTPSGLRKKRALDGNGLAS
jgi:hypothetical protein